MCLVYILRCDKKRACTISFNTLICVKTYISMYVYVGEGKEGYCERKYDLIKCILFFLYFVIQVN